MFRASPNPLGPLKVPALQAHSTLRYRDWRAVVAEFVAARLGGAAADLIPRTVAHCALGAAVAGYEHWLSRPGLDLAEVLDRTMRCLDTAFAG